VAPGDLIPRAAKAITTTVPIVMVTSTDPVREGLVQSVGRPGGNVTGLTLTAGSEIEAKRLEFLREVLPRLSRVAYLASKEDKDWENPLGEKPSDGGSGLGCDARPDGADPQSPRACSYRRLLALELDWERPVLLSALPTVNLDGVATSR
jgi:hypothetical protein